MSCSKLNLKFFHGLEAKGMRFVIDWCMKEGLLASRYVCPKCKQDMKLVERKDRDDGYNWVCRKKGAEEHYVKRSIRVGSWFEESKMSISDILCFTYLWVFEAKTELIRSELDLRSESTIVDWRNFCRYVCVDMCTTRKEKIGGPGVIVEIDESVFGKHKYTRGRRIRGQWVFGGVERGSNRCFFAVVEERSADVLLQVVKENIQPGTTIVSDCWKNYNCLSESGFVHLTVDHSMTFKDAETGAHTNTNDGLWGVVKRQFREQHHRRYTDLLEPYFAEFMCRRQFRNDLQGLFTAFLNCVKTIYQPQEQDKQEAD